MSPPPSLVSGDEKPQWLNPARSRGRLLGLRASGEAKGTPPPPVFCAGNALQRSLAYPHGGAQEESRWERKSQSFRMAGPESLQLQRILQLLRERLGGGGSSASCASPPVHSVLPLGGRWMTWGPAGLANVLSMGGVLGKAPPMSVQGLRSCAPQPSLPRLGFLPYSGIAWGPWVPCPGQLTPDLKFSSQP